MTHGRIATLGAALLLAMGLGLPAMAAADHEAIASYYDSQAADAKSKAELHRKMASTYSAGGTSIGKGLGPVPLPTHCTNLAKELDEEAAHYTAMASAHRTMAKAAK